MGQSPAGYHVPDDDFAIVARSGQQIWSAHRYTQNVLFVSLKTKIIQKSSFLKNHTSGEIYFLLHLFEFYNVNLETFYADIVLIHFMA